MALNLFAAPVRQAARRLMGHARAPLAATQDAAPKAAAQAMQPAGNAYVRTVLINDIGDLALPDDVWEEKHWGRRAGLKSVVESQGYRQGSQRWVAASVELELPAETVHHDRRLGGELTSRLARELVALHNHSFLARLPEGLGTARYLVRDAGDLAAGQARVRLGPAVHVKAEGERLAWRVELSADGCIWSELPPLHIPEQQRLFILAGGREFGSQVCRAWPFAAHAGLVMLNHPGEAELEFSSEPLDLLYITHRPDLDCHVVQAKDAGPDAPRLFVRAVRLVPVAAPTCAASPATPYQATESDLPLVGATDDPNPTARALARGTLPQRREPTLEPLPPTNATSAPASSASATSGTSAADDAPTLVQGRAAPQACPGIPDDCDAPTLYKANVVPPPCTTLVLEGLALQRPSRFAVSGVLGLKWGVDAQGTVLAADAPSRQLRFTVDAADQVHLATAAGQRAVAVGEALPLPGSDAVLRLLPLPSELSESHLGWLKLPPGRAVRLPHGSTLAVGRQLPANAELQPLAGTGFLSGVGDVPHAGGDRMGLSRRHLDLQASADGLRVLPHGNARVAHLDASMAFVEMADATRPALLAPGDCVVVGHYVWRLVA